MARQVLPVNFQDDVLNASMNGKRRYMLLQQDDGSYILNDVTNYDTEGSTFGAAQINATNQAVNQSVDKDDVLNTSEEVEANVDEKKVTGALVTKQLISEFQAWFGVTEDGQRGWKEQGADTVHPFRSGIIFRNKPLYWSSYPNGYDTNIRRYNISEECPYYKKLTIDNLVVRALGTDRAYSIGYDPNSGYITVDQGFLWGNNGTCDIAIVYPLDNG